MKEWIEDHPYMAGALGIGLILVFVLLRRASSGGSASGPSGTYVSGPSDAQIAAGTQLQAMALQGQTQVAGYDAQVRIADYAYGADVEKTRIGALVSLQGILSGADVQNKYTAAELEYGLAALGKVPNASAGAPAPNYSNSTVVSSAPITTLPTPSVSTFANSGGVNTPVPTSYKDNNFTVGESWDQFYASKLQGQPVNNPNVGFPDPSAVALRENIWAGAETAWVTDRNSPHFLPGGDWYDTAGQLQSCASSPFDSRCNGGSLHA